MNGRDVYSRGKYVMKIYEVKIVLLQIRNEAKAVFCCYCTQIIRIIAGY